MGRTITYRAVGRDFSGRADRLDALREAIGYARGYLTFAPGVNRSRSVTIFQVGAGILPLPVDRVYVDRVEHIPLGERS